MSKGNEAVEIATLPSGLKVAVRRRKGAMVDYCGAIVGVGSRDDAPADPGMAHFVEHTIFKGTQRRSSWHIINRMEKVGGELNAYTSKEETVVYTAAPSGNLTRSVELIADLIINSRFPDSELDKEREVVADEINSYLDTPAEAVYDDFEEILFADTPMGHNILGTVEALSTFDSKKCCRYLHDWYTAPNITLFYSGKQGPEAVIKAVEKHFRDLPTHQAPRIAADLRPAKERARFSKDREIGAHQCHTVLGAITPGMYSEWKHPIALLTNILGGPGMNSLLNVQLREKRGLVYSVEASNTWLTDCGLFTIYYGCDHSDNAKCAELVMNQIEQIAAAGLTPSRLAEAKKQYIGQLAVASDNYESMAIATGRSAKYFDRVLSPEQVAQHIQAVTADQLREAAKMLSRLSRLTFY